MPQSFDFDLLPIHYTRRKCDIFFYNTSLHAESFAIRAWLSHYASRTITLLASFPYPIVADNRAPATALKALPRLASLLGPRPLARVAYHSLVHLDERLDPLNRLHKLNRHIGLVVSPLRLILHVTLLLLTTTAFIEFKEIVKLIPVLLRILLLPRPSTLDILQNYSLPLLPFVLSCFHFAFAPLIGLVRRSDLSMLSYSSSL